MELSSSVLVSVFIAVNQDEASQRYAQWAGCRTRLGKIRSRHWAYEKNEEGGRLTRQGRKTGENQ